MIDVYERVKELLNKDKSRLPNGYVQCLASQLEQVLSGYMDIRKENINISFEYLGDGNYEVKMIARGEKLNNAGKIK